MENRLQRRTRNALVILMLTVQGAASAQVFNLVDRTDQCISQPRLGLSHNINPAGPPQAVESADAFRVPDGPDWRLDTLRVRGSFNGTNLMPDSVTLRLYTDAIGAPGSTALAPCQVPLTELGPQANNGNFEIDLTTSCGTTVLPAGAYWLSVVFNGEVGAMPGQGRYWYWDQSQAGGKFNWHMREFADVGGPDISCPDWVPRDDCSVGVSQEENLCFALSGDTQVTLVQPLADQFASAGTSFLMAAAASFVDPDGDVLNFSATGLPASLSIDALTGIISGTVLTEDVAGSPHTVLVTVDDEDGFTAQDTFTLVVPDDEVADFRFERLWPVLQQPWYFGSDAPDIWFTDDVLYVANDAFSRIQLFSPTGLHIANSFIEGPGGPGTTGKPRAVAANEKGLVYAIGDLDQRVHMLDANGTTIRTFGSAQLDEVPGFIAVTNRGCRKFGGCVFVGESDRVLKFTAEGQFLTAFGACAGPPCGGGTVQQLGGVVASDDGFVYLTDAAEDQVVVLRYDADTPLAAPPQFVGEFGSSGTGPGQFQAPGDIALDEQGRVFVADADRVQAFAANGTPLQEFSPAQPDRTARRFELGPNGFGFLANDLAQIQRFRLVGDIDAGAGVLNFRPPFASSDNDPGFFRDPIDLTAGPNSNMYVADRANHRVQKFSPDGALLQGFGQEGSGPGQFDNLIALGTGSIGGEFRLHVLDSSPDMGGNSYRIQRFDNSGTLVDAITPPAGADYVDMAVGGQGSAYLVTAGGSVLRLSPQGDVVGGWGSDGANGQFRLVDLAPNGLLYFVVESPTNEGFEVFTKDGGFVQFLEAPFNSPAALTVADDGKIVVGEIPDVAPDVPRIKIYRQDGVLLQSIGQYGYFPGSFAAPAGLDFAPNGKLYVADRDNDNVQVLNPVLTPDNTKVVIVAGGGPYAGNNLWETTQSLTNFAYLSLAYQGLTGDNILYLSSNLNEDLDGNGISDVDGAATLSNLQNAITMWGSDADHLVVYLADHGATDAFRLNPTSALDASELALALDTVQGGPGGVTDVTVIYDACRSGSFIDEVSNPAFSRVVMASAAANESAKFVSDGVLSFSSQFWTQIFVGGDLSAAFTTASQVMTASFSDQNPQLDADGDQQTNEASDDLAALSDRFIGAGTDFDPGSPTITSVTPPVDLPSGNSATISAFGVSDPDGVGRVYVELTPPDYTDSDPDKPVQSFPRFDLERIGATTDYEGTYDGFSSEGIYVANVFAQDRYGNTSSPSATTVTVGNPQQRKALIVVGGEISDTNWAAYSNNGSFAYASLLAQGYADDVVEEVRYLSNGGAAGVDDISDESSVAAAFAWAGTNAQDVTVYLVGGIRSGALRLASGQQLTAAALDAYLDTLEAQISGTLVVVYEGDRSGAFIRRLKPASPGRRILVTSAAASQAASFFLGGTMSFSQFFFNGVLNGDSVLDAFDTAREGIAFATGAQTPQLDDNGNGEGNDAEDGTLSRSYAIGSGVVQDANTPTIGSIVADITLTDGSTDAAIQVDDVISTGPVQQVFGIVTGPAPQRFAEAFLLSQVAAKTADNGSYSGTYSGFGPLPNGDYASGQYTVSIYARDDRGNISFQQSMVVEQTQGRDGWEGDDLAPDASVINVDDEQSQPHNLHDDGDQDWAAFYADNDELGMAQTYEIEVAALDDYQGQPFNVTLELHHPDAVSNPIATTSGGIGGDLSLTWPPAMAAYNEGEGQYLVRIAGQSTTQRGKYELRVFRPDVAQTGQLTGAVVDAMTGDPVPGAFVTTGANVTSVSNLIGEFQLVENPGAYTITVTPPPGFEILTEDTVPVVESQTTWRLLEVQPAGVAPGAQTGMATAITQDTAVLNGIVAPNGQATSSIEFQIAGNPPGVIIDGVANLAASDPQSDVAAAVSGLACGSNYSFLLSATNASGTGQGSVESFATLDCGVNPPTIESTSALNISSSGATLRASVNAMGADTTVSFRSRPQGGVFSSYQAAAEQATGSSAQNIDFALTGLSCGVTYEFQVQAVNAGGSAESVVDSFATAACQPQIETTVAINVTASAATLRANVNAMGSITTVAFRNRLSGGTFGAYQAAGQQASGSATQAIDFALADLSCDTAYEFQVQASNAGGTVESAVDSFVTTGCPPQIEAIAALNITATGATLRASVNAMDAATTVAFRSRLSGGSFGPYLDASPQATGSQVQDIEFALTGLACASDYEFQARAQNAAGEDSSAVDSFSTAACPLPQVTSLSADNITAASADLSASIDPVGLETEVRYRIEPAGEAAGPWLPAATVAVTQVVTVPVAGLDCGRSYQFNFEAENANGLAQGTEQTFGTATCPPGFPVATTVAASAVGQSMATLNASVDAGGSDSQVSFHYGPTPVYSATVDLPDLVTGTGATPVAIDVAGLDCHSQYHFQVQATNAAGTSFGSDQVFTTNPCDRILLVDDDDDDPDVRSIFAAALDALGFEYDVWPTGGSDTEPSAAELADYTTVLWFTGDADGAGTGPGAASEAQLTAWLGSGACLAISSQGYFTVRAAGGEPTDFMRDQLGVLSGTSDVAQTQVSGQGADFAGLPAAGAYVLDFAGANLTSAADQLEPDSSAGTAFTGAVGSAAVQRSMPAARTLWLGFPLPAIADPTERGAVVSATLDYCRGVEVIHASGFESP